MEPNSKQIAEYLKIGLYGVGAYFLYQGIMHIAQTFGLSKTQAEQNIDTAGQGANTSATVVPTSNDPFAAFNPKYASALVSAYNKKYSPKVFNGTMNLGGLSLAQYQDFATRINDSKGFFINNNDSLYDVFRGIQTQWQLSFLASVFSAFYKKDLFLYLKGFVSSEKFNDILNIIKGYPQYLK